MMRKVLSLVAVLMLFSCNDKATKETKEVEVKEEATVAMVSAEATDSAIQGMKVFLESNLTKGSGVADGKGILAFDVLQSNFITKENFDSIQKDLEAFYIQTAKAGKQKLNAEESLKQYNAMVKVDDRTSAPETEVIGKIYFVKFSMMNNKGTEKTLYVPMFTNLNGNVPEQMTDLLQ